MIKIGKLTDYAIVIIAQLSTERENSSNSANYISEKTHIPEPTVAKILKKLSQGGLLISVRGAAGGYRLSKPVSNISAGEVIAIMEGPLSIVDCARGENKRKRCFAKECCSVKHNWSGVNTAIEKVLNNIKLNEMMHDDAATFSANLETRVCCKNSQHSCDCDNSSECCESEKMAK